MGLFAAIIVTPIIVTGVFFGSPLILGLAGLSAVGPVAGGLFSLAQGSTIAAGSWMASAQSIAMVAALPTP